MHPARSLPWSLAAATILGLLLSHSSAIAGEVSFGSGANQFTMEFVPIGNPGNPADTTGDPNPAGSVAYNYQMGKFEVSEDMIDKANTLGGLGITKNARGANKPATFVSWNEAARFVNWLNVSQGFSPAYNFTAKPGDGDYNADSDISLWVSGDAGFNAANPFRNSMAQYFLPSTDEWYKAAYYNPTSGIYFDYPTGSNLAPTAVSSGTTAGTAVYLQAYLTSPADITQAGGLSPYGTMGQGGNVIEWEETEFDLVNDWRLSGQGIRGGVWFTDSTLLLASSRISNGPGFEDLSLGFRVASVSIPEPSSLLLGALTGAGVLWRRRR